MILQATELLPTPMPTRNIRRYKTYILRFANDVIRERAGISPRIIPAQKNARIIKLFFILNILEKKFINNK